MRFVVVFIVVTVIILSFTSVFLFKAGYVDLSITLTDTGSQPPTPPNTGSQPPTLTNTGSQPPTLPNTGSQPPTLTNTWLQPPSQQWIQEQFAKSLSYRGLSYLSPPVWKRSHRTYYYPQIRAVYTGIPKTGCSNWLIALARAEGEIKPDRIIESDKVRFIHGRLSDRHRLQNIINYNETHFEEALSFVVVRNPWSRLVSGFRDKASAEKTQGGSFGWLRVAILRMIRGVTDEEVLKEAHPTFEEFVKWLVYRMKNRLPDGHFAPQSQTLCIPNIRYDFVIPIEFTSQLEGELWRKLNVTIPSVLGSYDKSSDPRNQSSALLAKQWLSALDPDLVEEFYRHFKQDFILMNYSNFSHPDFPLPLVNV